MGTTEDWRHLNFYGFKGARLRSDQSVRGNSSIKTSWFMKILSWCLFLYPYKYLMDIERICVDGFVRQDKWEIFWNKLKKDWSGVVLNVGAQQ